MCSAGEESDSDSDSNAEEAGTGANTAAKAGDNCMMVLMML